MRRKGVQDRGWMHHRSSAGVNGQCWGLQESVRWERWREGSGTGARQVRERVSWEEDSPAGSWGSGGQRQ